MKRSEARARRSASSVSSRGMASPNITVRGLMTPPQGGAHPGTVTPASSLSPSRSRTACVTTRR